MAICKFTKHPTFEDENGKVYAFTDRHGWVCLTHVITRDLKAGEYEGFEKCECIEGLYLAKLSQPLDPETVSNSNNKGTETFELGVPFYGPDSSDGGKENYQPPSEIECSKEHADIKVAVIDVYNEAPDKSLSHGDLMCEIIDRQGIHTIKFDTSDSIEVTKASLFKIICKIYCAINEKVKIINLSVGWMSIQMHPELTRAIQEAVRHGIIVVMSAGNDKTDLNDRFDQVDNTTIALPNHWPSSIVKDFNHARLEGLSLSVSGVDPELKIAQYSNYGNRFVTFSGLGYYQINHTDVWEVGTSVAAARVSHELLKILVDGNYGGDMKDLHLQLNATTHTINIGSAVFPTRYDKVIIA